MEKITLNGYIIVPDSQLEVVEPALDVHIKLTRAESGCIVFEVLQDSIDKNKFNVYEEFVDSVSFLAHQARVASSQWGEVSKDLVREYEVTGLDEK
ncbi:MAG: antibiotic biosynthesis monooxygenase [Oceanospirillaceae bacterium]|nr:antibiotic biosynthesis monooxygenase [Oceanospirillaceae bacterium]